jgi:2-hydroxy-3-oxopropionate reductase
MSKVGFIGLGIMGAPMAGHLIAGGPALFLYSRRPPKAELIDKGG